MFPNFITTGMWIYAYPCAMPVCRYLDLFHCLLYFTSQRFFVWKFLYCEQPVLNIYYLKNCIILGMSFCYNCVLILSALRCLKIPEVSPTMSQRFCIDATRERYSLHQEIHWSYSGCILLFWLYVSMYACTDVD